jgi:hypothetical protein
MITMKGDKIEGRWNTDMRDGDFIIEESGNKLRYYRGSYVADKKVGEWILSEVENCEERKLQIEEWRNGVMQNVRNIPGRSNEKQSSSRNRALISNMLEDSNSS